MAERRISEYHHAIPVNSTSQAIDLQDLEELRTLQNFQGQHQDISLNPIPITNSEIYDFPEGGRHAWTVVFGSFCVLFSTWGFLNTIGILQSYWQTHQLSAYSSTEIGWIGAVNVFLNLLLGVQIGPLFDRYGPRWILLLGSGGYAGSLFSLAQSDKYWQFMLSYGILGGVSSAFLTTAAVSVVAHWFSLKRGQASGICFIGSSSGGIVLPLMLRPLLDRLGWAWSIRIVAIMVCGLLVLANIFIRGRLPKTRGGTEQTLLDLKLFSDLRFTYASIGIASFEFVLIGAQGLLPTYIITSGFAASNAFNIVAVLNAASAVGRYAAGLIADRYGRFNAMLMTQILSIVVTFALGVPITNQLPLLYIFAAGFGFSTGCVISLAPVCFGQLCHASQYGLYYGTGYSMVSFTVLTCIPVSGALLPVLGPQGLLAFFGGILVLSFISFVMARWAYLEYHWKWKTNV